MSSKKISCHRCQYFFLTWQKDYSYGCKAFQMKSKVLPSRQVFLQSREECHYYQPKDNLKNKET